MGGGIFDNMFDPYSGAYAYPRAQRRARQQQRAPARAPEVRSEEPLRKGTVRTIPVVDVTPVAARKEEREGAVNLAASLRSEDAAAKKIQAVYRGYLVRKTRPLKHLRVIKEVKEELEGLMRRLEEPEQKKKLWSDAQERLRWTEGIMALLLRLDALQGVLPEVRLLRKAVTKELLQLQEMVDSMSVGLEVAAAAESGEEGSGSPAVQATDFEKHVPQVQSDMHDQVVDSHADESAPFPESVGEEVGFVLEPVSEEADPKVPLDVEKEQILTMVSATEEGEVEAASSQIKLPPVNVKSDNDEHLRVENSAETAEDASATFEKMWRKYEVGRLIEEAERLDMSHNGGNDASDSIFDPSSAHLEEKETSSGCRDQEGGRVTPADCIDDLQPSTADDINALSDRALMLHLLEENRKLKDVVKRVLQWGQHQNDVIHKLAARIKQLEEDQSQVNLVEDEESMDRNDVSLQRKGKPGNRPQLGNYIDSEDWPSAGSDDSF